MKQHIKVKLKIDVLNTDIPYWQDILNNKKIAKDSLHPEIDRIFFEYRIPVWVTKEYKATGKDWDMAELANGLNRVYRLIPKVDTPIPAQLVQQVSDLPFIEEVRIGELACVELPALMPTQMSTDTDIRSRSSIYLDEAHQFTKGEASVIVAVLDTGINLTHPELQHALLRGEDFVDIIDGAGKFIGDYLDYDDVPDDEVGHGTHVAGIIAGKGLMMPIGVVPNCKILPVRVLGAMERNGKRVGAGLVDNINTGIKWAVDNGANVINMSLGIRNTGGGLPHEEVVNYAKHKGVTIVAASGNDGQEQLYYPGALPYVIAVGAFDEIGNIANFSTYGKQVSFVAPGTNIYSSYLNNNYAFSSGTSHASPFVAGAVAMLKSYAVKKRNLRLSDNQIKYILKHTSDKIDTQFKHRKAGFGKLNLLDALRLLDYKLRREEVEKWMS
ncbi:protease [Calothrix sp. NIES-4071]|nr:protease [Calothrix sp. NIES-4071]BAZ57265.1 protease [Calothrix sp. NIES-4105]